MDGNVAPVVEGFLERLPEFFFVRGLEDLPSRFSCANPGATSDSSGCAGWLKRSPLRERLF